MNNRKKIHKYSLKERFDNFSKHGFTILMFGLPLIIIYLFFFLHLLLSSPDIPGDILSKIYRNTLEHMIMYPIPPFVCGDWEGLFIGKSILSWYYRSKSIWIFRNLCESHFLIFFLVPSFCSIRSIPKPPIIISVALIIICSRVLR